MENKDIQFHITVKGIVIYEGKTLILKRVRPSSDGLGYWELPGGGLEYGEDPHQALVRELKEETGLDIEIIKPVYTFTAIRPHYQTVGIGFLCIPTNDQVKISFEHTDYKFVDDKANQALAGNSDNAGNDEGVFGSKADVVKNQIADFAARMKIK